MIVALKEAQEDRTCLQTLYCTLQFTCNWEELSLHLFGTHHWYANLQESNNYMQLACRRMYKMLCMKLNLNDQLIKNQDSFQALPCLVLKLFSLPKNMTVMSINFPWVLHLPENPDHASLQSPSCFSRRLQL